MQTITLTRGKEAIVDDKDYARVSQFKWCADKSKNKWYAHRGVYLGGGRKNCKIRKVKMHRFILGLRRSGTPIVDHINGNGLDNRRSNLRTCRHTDNIQRGPHKPNKNGFIGVSRRLGCRSRPFVARICDNGVRRFLGFFATAEAAAKKYDTMAIRIHGQHARTNFPCAP